MKLADFGIYRYSLPFTEPLKLAGATLNRREGLLLRLTAESGAEGWGEAAPLPGFSREALDEAASGLRSLAEAVLGREVSDTYPDAAPDPVPSARFGFETALSNLRAVAEGRTLAGVLTGGAPPRETVALAALLSGPPERVLEGAERARAAGYRAVKLKVGRRDVGEDAALARSVAAVLGDGVSLRLDANRAWGFGEAVEFVRLARGTRFEYLEEPLSEPELLPELARETGAAVALDESLVGIEPEDLADHRYVRAVVLKPTMLGGLRRSLRFAEEASRLGMTPVVSSAYESGVGMLALVALASRVGDAPAGLDTHRRLAADLLRPAPDLAGAVVGVREILGVRRGVEWGALREVAEAGV